MVDPTNPSPPTCTTTQLSNTRCNASVAAEMYVLGGTINTFGLEGIFDGEVYAWRTQLLGRTRIGPGAWPPRKVCVHLTSFNVNKMQPSIVNFWGAYEFMCILICPLALVELLVFQVKCLASITYWFHIIKIVVSCFVI